ncbi:MAG: GntR family transcriptional regulator [Terriglobia bacterium]
MALRIPDNLTQRAYRAIRDEILKGKLNDQMRLTEGFFASRFKISKSPIREAMNRLETEGLITIRPRRGAFVSGFSRRDIEEIYDLRETLEAAAVRKVALDAKACARLRAALNAAKASLREKNKVGYVLADADFHRIIAQANPNSRLRKILESMHGQMLILRHSTYELSSNSSVVQHQRILEALEKGNSEAAGRLMAQHIRAVKAKLLASSSVKPRPSSSER